MKSFITKYVLIAGLSVMYGCDYNDRRPVSVPQTNESSGAKEVQMMNVPWAVLQQDHKLVTLESLPDPAVIREIRLKEGLNVSHGGKLDEDSFLAILGSARVIDADDPTIRAWAYAPWYSGTFGSPEGVYGFELYLGGRGKLVCPDQTAGYFSFVVPGE